MNRSASIPYRLIALIGMAACLVPGVAQAGMPSYSLTDVARMRIETISFFLLVVLLSAWAIQGLWNGLRKDITKMPRLSYRGALFGTVLWGLLCLCVLTMISGARELLTPGAWEKNGSTYQLAGSVDESADGDVEPAVTLAERELQLMRLQKELWNYAADHDGGFPASVEASEISESLWTQPGQPPVQYLYHAGHTLADGATPIVREYSIYNDDVQFVLNADGTITKRDLTAIRETANANQQVDVEDSEAQHIDPAS